MYTGITLAPNPLGVSYWTRAFNPHIKRSLITIVAEVAACGFLFYAIKRMHYSLRLLQQTRDDLPIGLPNPQNLCYLNALLQAMAANSTLVRFLQSSALKRRNKLLLCLICILKGLRCSSRYLVDHGLQVTLKVIHAELLNELMVVHRWGMEEQQDAHELFTLFMDIACFREHGYSATRAADGLTSVSRFTGQRFETVVPNCFHRYRLANDDKPLSLVLRSPLQTEVFQRHFIVTQVACSRCEYRSSPVLQPEACITLFFDPSRNTPNQRLQRKPESTLDACLRKQFSVSERLPDMHCPKCQSKTTTSSLPASAAGYCQRNQWIAHLPSCLVLHVQRGQWQTDSMSSGFRPVVNATPKSVYIGSGVKCADHVAFPCKLDMSRYTSKSRVSKEPVSGDCLITDGEKKLQSSATPKLYLLRAILVHQGNSINAGHYITYRAWTNPGPASQNRRGCFPIHILQQMFTAVSNFFQGFPYINTEPASSPWIFASDSRVIRVTADEVRDCAAYMLFYEQTTAYNLITNGSRQKHQNRLSRTESPTAEYADWEQAEGYQSAGFNLMEEATARNTEEELDDDDEDACSGFGDVEDYDNGEEPDDFVITNGSRADVIKSLALAISQM